MAGMTSVLPGLLSTGVSVFNTTQKSRDTSTDNRRQQEQIDYQRQQDELARQREAEQVAYAREQEQARLEREAAAAQAATQAAKEEQDRRYREEQAARDYEAQLRAEEQRKAWERDDALRAQDEARRLDEAEATRQEEEAKRAQAMEIFSGSQARDWEAYIQRQNQEFAAKESGTQADVARINTDTAAAEEQRRAALRQTMARARASLGARGVGSTNGSGRAILQGQVATTDAESEASQAAAAAERRTLQDNVDNTRRVNLLAQAEFKERQRMDYLNRFYS